ncbi:HNH endonuclease [Desulfovibrio desulfuricans]|uniref:ABC-three component system protein n=1 Tax=Desulfovibrio desulfuricans TaxID=876 RepID=UPI001F30AF2E|nr:ABC-three component system protein [Desulfovibrio desulfuricans]UIB00726.1 HNH endonuclease [Desulfovibrio desulfuricans]
MNSNRKAITETLKNHLLDEVNSLCPICGTSLLPQQGNEFRRIYEIAHIYPLNPTESQLKIIPHIEMLGTDINGFENLLAACPKCHTEYDKYFSVDDYNKWKNIKLALRSKRNIKNVFSVFNIEDDIADVINSLSAFELENELEKIDYKTLKIDQKLVDDIPFVLKKTIKNDVVDYFKFIQSQFFEICKENSLSFDIIASQVKSFYIKCKQEGFKQFEIYNILADWLDNKTKYKSKRACEIVIAFFIQDCEIYS